MDNLIRDVCLCFVRFALLSQNKELYVPVTELDLKHPTVEFRLSEGDNV